jgi:hypothetical protein
MIIFVWPPVRIAGSVSALNCNDTDSGVVSDTLQHLHRRLRAELCSTRSIGSAETVGAIFPSLRQKQVKTPGDALI